VGDRPAFRRRAAKTAIVVMDENAQVLGRGTTDKDGVFYAISRPALEDTWRPVFAFVGDPDNPDQDFAATVNQWSDGISPWEFNLPVEDYLQPYAAYFFTDRAIYRPGQKVYFKASCATTTTLTTRCRRRTGRSTLPSWIPREPRS